MILKIETERRVESFDADLHNKLKISSLFNFMQDIAAQHADNLGVGYNILQKHQIFWVLSWAKVTIEALPSYGDRIKIQSWAKGKNRLFYMRDFIISNDRGEEIIRATSAWLLLNAQTKRVTDLEKIGLDLSSCPKEHAIDEYPGKYNFELNNETNYMRKILYSDIDINKHVNNSRYLEYILDCYNQADHESKELKTVTISYKGETHFMDELTISRSKLTEKTNHDFIKAVRNSDSKDIFNCLLEWK